MNLIAVDDERLALKNLLSKLTQMRGHLGAEKTKLLASTDSALGKLQNMSNTEYATIHLFLDFDAETE